MYSQIAANKRKTVYLIIFFILIVALLGWVIGLYATSSRVSTVVVAMVSAVVYAVVAYFISSKAALALNHAKPIEKSDNPRLFRIVENLAITEGLPTPNIYVIEDPALNAFATGRDPHHASVAVTTGLLDVLSDTELEGVVAHELGHVKNYDIRVAMLVFGLVAAIGLLADILLRMTWFRDDESGPNNGLIMVVGVAAAILAPIIALIVQMAVSRKREYLADATGALATRYPQGLADALEKIKQSGSAMKRQNSSTAHLYFANPLKGKSITNMFSTHPPIDERIARLKQMESRQ